MKIYAFDINFEKFKDIDLWSFVYIHGSLQDENGFDLIGCNERPTKDGIYDVTVVLSNGNERKSKLYFWKDKEWNRDRGLIVANDDTQEMHKYALQKYKKKTDIL